MSESNTEIPKEFCKVSKDFITDILTTFPEYKETLHEGLIDILQENNDTAKVREVFDYVKEIYPERFFDLLYQNQEIFTDESINTKFLPNIEFAELWKQDISDKTKLVIWKYLQLLLFAVVNNESDGKSFGDTAKLFEAINEDELKNKLEETMEQMANIGSEVLRSIQWKEKDVNISQLAFERSLELFDLSLDSLHQYSKLKETARAREVWVDYYWGDNEYRSTSNQWINYFMQFTYLARNQQGRS